MTYREEDGDDVGDPEVDSDTGASDESGVESHHGASRYGQPQETSNQNETIIGISEEGCPKPLQLFEAWSTSMQKLDPQADKLARAVIQHCNVLLLSFLLLLLLLLILLQLVNES